MKKIIFLLSLLTLFTTTTKAQQIDAKKSFNNTLNAYFEVKNALTKDDVNLASNGAKHLSTSIKNFPVHKLTPAQQKVWKTETLAIDKATLAISTAKEIKTQRNSFWILSSAIIKLTKSIKLSNTDLYVQYCPMVKKNWLNEVEDIQNPFYGSMMYDCGEVSETIAKR